MRDPHRRGDLLHAALDESDVVAGTEAERFESLRLLARDVAWRRVALRVDLGVVANERLPVFVARTLDRFANLLAVESGFDQLFAWYGNGDIPIATAQPKRAFRMTFG